MNTCLVSPKISRDLHAKFFHIQCAYFELDEQVNENNIKHLSKQNKNKKQLFLDAFSNDIISV